MCPPHRIINESVPDVYFHIQNQTVKIENNEMPTPQITNQGFFSEESAEHSTLPLGLLAGT